MLKFEALSKRFGAVTALRDVSFEITERSVYALLGPNGAGKSTAIEIALNLQRPTAGRVHVLGTDSRRLGPGELGRIGYVSEARCLPEWMRVDRFFAYCREFYSGWHVEDLAALVRLYGLPLDRPLKSLSRGMRIQAATAAALAGRPALLILDEPFSGLDVLVREQMIESIAGRTGECTVFLASHDIAELESFATHVAYLEEGRIRFVEEMGDLSARFREIEVVVDDEAQPAAELPASWLNPERSARMIRFVDSQYDAGVSEQAIRSRFAAIRDVTIRPLTLRAIVVALAKSAKGGVPCP